MRSSVIAGFILVCSFFIATSVLAQTRPTAHNAAGMCRGRTAAANACFDGNNEGWLWYNWTGSGACNGQTAPLVCGLEETVCVDSTKDKRVTVDGNCSSAMTCNVRVVRWSDGAVLAGYPIAISGGPGDFHKSVDIDCLQLGTRNYVTVNCDVPIGCKIWGVNSEEVSPVVPPAAINLGPVNTQTMFTVNGTQALIIDQLTFPGWTPGQIVIGFGHTDAPVLDGVSVSVNGGPAIALSGHWYTISVPFTGQAAINLTVTSATPRALRTDWWAQ